MAQGGGRGGWIVACIIAGDCLCIVGGVHAARSGRPACSRERPGERARSEAAGLLRHATRRSRLGDAGCVTQRPSRAKP
eukprot:scaffold1195_cov358-Prasinococcus_capsulatus_cf.AAC.7